MNNSMNEQFFELHNQCVEASDPDVAAALRDERKRQNEGLELIASENFVSLGVMAAMGSVMTNKYAEGYPAKRYYGGCKYVDVAEELAPRSQLLGEEAEAIRITQDLLEQVAGLL